MNPEDIGRITTEPEIIGRYEVTEMHLFDDDAGEEEALCKVDTSDDYIRSATYYLEDRLHGARVGVVCQGCKERAIPFAVNVAQDLEAEGLLGEAEEYRQLVETLDRETSHRWQARSPICGRLLRFSACAGSANRSWGH